MWRSARPAVASRDRRSGMDKGYHSGAVDGSGRTRDSQLCPEPERGQRHCLATRQRVCTGTGGGCVRSGRSDYRNCAGVVRTKFAHCYETASCGACTYAARHVLKRVLVQGRRSTSSICCAVERGQATAARALEPATALLSPYRAL